MSENEMEDWTGEVGDRWLAHIDSFEAMIAPIGAALIARCGFQPGERVVDIGCGGGLTTLDIARAVGPGGHATGVDIAPRLTALARQRQASAGIANADFRCGDAQELALERASFDRLTSRFGVMFFADSTAAFTNMRGWLKPGGRVDFACWGPPPENPWIGIVGGVIGQFVEMPQPDPAAPGPFRFADPEATGAMLRDAGYRDVEFTLHKADQPLGGAGGVPDAVNFVLEAMAMREPLAAAGAVDAASAALAEAFGPYERDGAVMLPGASWFVSAVA